MPPRPRPSKSKRNQVKRDRAVEEDKKASQRREQEKKYVKNVTPQTPGQKLLIEAIDCKSVVLALGPAGSGKTYLAVAKGAESLAAGTVNRLILTRPAVEAGEKLGFLPGDLDEKLDPYMRPIYDVLHDRLGADRLKNMKGTGEIEVAPLAFLRGRTLSNAFIVVDEAQNCTFTQLVMAVTRIGFNSTMVFTGDPDQSDLPSGQSGLAEFARRLESVEDVGKVRLGACDIVRHVIIGKLLKVLKPSKESQ